MVASQRRVVIPEGDDKHRVGADRAFDTEAYSLVGARFHLIDDEWIICSLDVPSVCLCLFLMCILYLVSSCNTREGGIGQLRALHAQPPESCVCPVEKAGTDTGGVVYMEGPTQLRQEQLPNLSKDRLHYHY